MKANMYFGMARGAVAAALLIGWVFLAAGCNVFRPVADGTRFYLLRVELAVPSEENNLGEGAMEIALGRVTVPRYLEPSSMMIRTGSHELRRSSVHHWAEPLDQAVARILKDGLEAHPPVKRVVAHPARPAHPHAANLTVNLVRAEGVSLPGQPPRAAFEARWQLSLPGMEGGASGRVAALDLPWDGNCHGQLAASLSQGVEMLLADIGAALRGPS